MKDGPDTDQTVADKDILEPNPTSQHPTLETNAPSNTQSTAHSWLNGLRRPKSAPGPRWPAFRTRSHLSEDEAKRDSGLATSISTLGRESVVESVYDGSVISKAPSLPTNTVNNETLPQASVAADAHEREASVPQLPTEKPIHQDQTGSFRRITTPIPTGSFDDLSSPDNIEFSHRGSMLWGGKKAATAVGAKDRHTQSHGRAAETSSPVVGKAGSQCGRILSSRVLSPDEKMLSKKVRSMYEHGDEKAGEEASQLGSPTLEISEASLVGNESISTSPTPDASSLSVQRLRPPGPSGSKSPRTMDNRRISLIIKEPHETAGGIEDWADVEGGDVDRYGFIVPKKVSSRDSSSKSFAAHERPGLARTSTVLQLASDTPRRKRTLRRAPSNPKSARSTKTNPPPKRKSSQRSFEQTGSVYSNLSNTSRSRRSLRHVANRLPHNKDRRWMDEASDMLTLPPGLADIAEQEDGGRAAMAMKKKEWEREEKWRKMGKLKPKSGRGGGMIFEFDTKDPKVISRAWKGIPDRWRSMAWHSFLSASAREAKGSPSEEELVQAFYELQEVDSADDVQIDVDVPRTISSHIMFRRRYRGGQRLLFRVLHAMSLYLPDTGYVQGMATLAATLLCYFDEEKAFVMLVRLWQLRGLERLYQSGFDGLMEALNDFEKNWLAGGDVAQKLDELGITSTAYGTRWYLTLFNYSIPFPAQLRVWDVFMLLGDASNASPDSPPSFGADLDVLHATSAALIDATREILLDSDFENAMKVLTSWIPVKDEDLLMKVAKAEWKQRKRRARAAT
ncbi:hypothetical protein H2201_001982 [Coniosporium apollinis]|uniref:Rab-GAP TBC domain-containing protein n=1 Tax=Coniosporium apollinis TaxID=61459 RepID=A0ABQ9P1D0_9PEZI|nr:hypothetical protein H2201_001982 [Coniosporium apollinis]